MLIFAVDTVIALPRVVEPMIRVPAVTAAKSAEAILNVPLAPAMPTVWVPLGLKVTLPLPALMVPDKLTSLAVMVIAEFVEEMDVDTALVTLPVPSVVMVTLFVPVALALSVTLPFEPDDVCNTSVLPERALEAVIVPLPVRLSAPVADVTVPEVPMVAEAPVVVTVKLPPTDDVPIMSVPVSLMSAVPLPPELAVRVVVAVKIGVPDEPMLPVPDVRFTVPEVTVTEPVRVIVPEPLALRLTEPEVFVDMLALTAMPELLPFVERLTAEAPDIVMLELTPTPTVSVPPELTVTAPVEPEMPPKDVVLDAPSVLIVRFLAPRVIVWLADVKVPPLLN